ncbi:hypothetical protein D3C86_680270 [compost metagenome]
MLQRYDLVSLSDSFAVTTKIISNRNRTVSYSVNTEFEIIPIFIIPPNKNFLLINAYGRKVIKTRLWSTT